MGRVFFNYFHVFKWVISCVSTKLTYKIDFNCQLRINSKVVLINRPFAAGSHMVQDMP